MFSKIEHSPTSERAEQFPDMNLSGASTSKAVTLSEIRLILCWKGTGLYCGAVQVSIQA